MALEDFETVEFESSVENDEYGIPTHRVEIKILGKTVALGVAKIISEPQPLVFIKSLDVLTEHMSRGYGRYLMDQMEKLIIEGDKVGLLYDQIEPGMHHSVYEMYKRRKLKVVPETSSLMYFNAKSSADIEKLKRIYKYGLDPMYNKGEIEDIIR